MEDLRVLRYTVTGELLLDVAARKIFRDEFGVEIGVIRKQVKSASRYGLEPYNEWRVAMMFAQLAKGW